eukprot:TRINITY_DN5842_c0_g1_i2.p1 TRINITY_DN5842_c0_g1~~TRINITY_DN5842_c0_g1_i2.p1  ORF type:complete len:437 (-),score=83.16 TRINITY_DN5842_c0_g1_i2:49-1359(-)
MPKDHLEEPSVKFILHLRETLQKVLKKEPELQKGPVTYDRVANALGKRSNRLSATSILTNARSVLGLSSPADVFRLHCKDLIKIIGKCKAIPPYRCPRCLRYFGDWNACRVHLQAALHGDAFAPDMQRNCEVRRSGEKAPQGRRSRSRSPSPPSPAPKASGPATAPKRVVVLAAEKLKAAAAGKKAAKAAKKAAKAAKQGAICASCNRWFVGSAALAMHQKAKTACRKALSKLKTLSKPSVKVGADGKVCKPQGGQSAQADTTAPSSGKADGAAAKAASARSKYRCPSCKMRFVEWKHCTRHLKQSGHIAAAIDKALQQECQIKDGPDEAVAHRCPGCTKQFKDWTSCLQHVRQTQHVNTTSLQGRERALRIVHKSSKKTAADARSRSRSHGERRPWKSARPSRDRMLCRRLRTRACGALLFDCLPPFCLRFASLF